jgi:hypothetical protein
VATTKSDRGESGSSMSSLLTGAGAKLRQINPNAAKTSTQSGIAGVKDLASTAVAYAKQETVGPLKGLGRFAAAGFASSIFFATSFVLAGLAALRGIQDATGARKGRGGTFSGTLSWIPYLLAVLVCLILLGLVGFSAVRATRSSSSSASGDRR